jgi:hypothetical protein
MGETHFTSHSATYDKEEWEIEKLSRSSYDTRLDILFWINDEN